jgi:hypothetical protein
MEFSLWTYPWDIIDEGGDSVVKNVEALGVSELNLATNYHSLHAFLPHNPERRAFFSNARSYFQPGDDYGRLEPVPNEEMGGDDWLRTIDEGLAGSDVSLNSWTIGCHNSWLGREHPDLTMKSPYGDSLRYGLCPSKPAVQEYLVNVVSDLAERESFRRIELESFDYMFGTGLGWHHRKFHTRLGDLGEFLFGLCFCDDCVENANAEGIDTDHVRAVSRNTVDAIAEHQLPHDMSVESWLAANPEVRRYLDVRTDTLAGLYEDLAAASGDAELGCYIGIIGVDKNWMIGAELEKLAESLDYYTVMAYESTPKGVIGCMQMADAITPDIPLHAGLLPAHPAVYEEETVVSMVDALAAEGTDRVSFYNYGMLPQENLRWVGEAAGRHQ